MTKLHGVDCVGGPQALRELQGVAGLRAWVTLGCIGVVGLVCEALDWSHGDSG